MKYWPSASPEMYGPVLVSPGDEEELADYVVRKFSVQMVRGFDFVIFFCFVFQVMQPMLVEIFARWTLSEGYFRESCANS